MVVFDSCGVIVHLSIIGLLLVVVIARTDVAPDLSWFLKWSMCFYAIKWINCQTLIIGSFGLCCVGYSSICKKT